MSKCHMPVGTKILVIVSCHKCVASEFCCPEDSDDEDLGINILLIVGYSYVMKCFSLKFYHFVTFDHSLIFQ